MKKDAILFIGNYFTDQTVFHYIGDELIVRLNQNGWLIHKTSRFKQKAIRLLDILLTIWRRRKDYEVAQVDVFSGPAFIWAEAATFLLHLLRKPIILTLHGGNLPNFAARHPERVGRVLKLAKMVVTPSGYLFEQFREIRKDIQIIPNPVEIERYVYRSRDLPEPKLIWLRAFHEIYNPALAPRVIAELKHTWPDVWLAMVGPDKGDGSKNHMLDVANSLQVQDRISLPGLVPRDKVPDWLNANDVFINTTNIDNTPVSVIEAMACGLCIVSTNVGGLPHLLEDGVDALLVPPDNPVAMADSINRILSSPDLAIKLSENARRKAEKFSWGHVLPLWEEIFHKAIGSQ